MSPHLIIVLVFAGMVALSAGIATRTWSTRPASETEVRDYREKFFSGVRTATRAAGRR